MTSSPAAGGAALTPTTYTYTAAMRAALGGHMHSRALHIWNDAWRRHQAGQLQLDARLCITYIELCARMGLTDQALGMYAQMLGAPSRGRMAPTVHAFTAAMRAATEGGRWTKALEIWEDMRRAGCEATGECSPWVTMESCCSALPGVPCTSLAGLPLTRPAFPPVPALLPACPCRPRIRRRHQRLRRRGRLDACHLVL